MGLRHVIVIIGALGVLAVLYDLAWSLFDRFRPLRYKDLALPELRDHFEQFLRRAVRSAEMVVESDAGDALLCIRKWYPYAAPGMEYYVVFPGVRTSSAKAKGFCEALGKRSMKCARGVARPNKYRRTLACKCKDLDQVMEATALAIDGLLGLPAGAEFSVFVKGGIESGNIVCDGLTSMRVSLAATFTDFEARPYKRWQVRNGMLYWAGRVAGALARKTQSLLFPSRGPEDDLKR